MNSRAIRTNDEPEHYTRERVENEARAFWQSKMVFGGKVPPAPHLIDIPALAQIIRRTWSIK